jgi:hypothetical protein
LQKVKNKPEDPQEKMDEIRQGNIQGIIEGGRKNGFRKSDLELLREEIIESCPNPNDPRRKIVRAAMMTLQDKAADDPVDKYIASRILDLYENIQERNGSEDHSISR